MDGDGGRDEGWRKDEQMDGLEEEDSNAQPLHDAIAAILESPVPVQANDAAAAVAALEDGADQQEEQEERSSRRPPSSRKRSSRRRGASKPYGN